MQRTNMDVYVWREPLCDYATYPSTPRQRLDSREKHGPYAGISNAVQT